MVIPHSGSYPHAKFEGNLLLFKFEPHTKSGLTIPQCGRGLIENKKIRGTNGRRRQRPRRRSLTLRLLWDPSLARSRLAPAAMNGIWFLG